MYILILVLLSLLYSTLVKAAVPPKWARTVTAGLSDSTFNSVAVDSGGNIYVAGFIFGNGDFYFGKKAMVTGGSYGALNAVLVKYNSNGEALWARSVISKYKSSKFLSVAVDPKGDIYVGGYISDTGSYNFGNKVTVNGASSSNNIVLVKYSSSGNPLWARSVVFGTNESYFYSIAVDLAGNVYAGGSIYNTGAYDFGNNVKINGSSSSSNIVLVKYNSSGDVQWATSTASGSVGSKFNSIAVDSDGNIYAGGYIIGNSLYGFGSGITCSGTASGQNSLLVKYNTNGDTQWAKSITSGSNNSSFSSVAINSIDDNIFAVGSINSNGVYGFGNNVTVNGSSSSGNIVLVKYNSNGIAQWARSVVSGSNESYFYSITVDSSEDIYSVGYINGNSNFGFGNSVTVTGKSSIQNPLFVKYDNNGNAQCAKSVIAASAASQFIAATVADRNIYAVGRLGDSSPYGFGNNVTVSGAYPGTNAVLVSYEDQDPILTNMIKYVDVNGSVTFTAADFTSHFAGYLSGLIKIKIVSLPNFGTLKLAGNNVTVNQEINVRDLENLAYKPDSDWQGNDDFSWIGSDETTYATNSAKVSIIVSTSSSTTEQLTTIVGIVSGVIGACATVAGGIYWCYKHHQKSQKTKVAPAP